MIMPFMRFFSRTSLWVIIGVGLTLSACRTKPAFLPKSDYPPDPWVKGFSQPDDCLGGEDLAAQSLDLPNYPRRAFNTGQQGWVIIRLDVKADGHTDNVTVERAIPGGQFSSAFRSAVKAWVFEPPNNGYLINCRVLLRFRQGEVTLG